MHVSPLELHGIHGFIRCLLHVREKERAMGNHKIQHCLVGNIWFIKQVLSEMCLDTKTLW